MWSVDFHRIPSLDKMTEAAESNPILNVNKYTQMGIPSGSLGEIYEEYKRLQKEVVGKRDMFNE
uniref:Uncharacterized protein n=1 Tax=Candidatus Kentrum sp. MB TaxID=2138164 RepID=A0A450XUX8_9GAMM|nr:MAG: hypothetical protein BECKMB1821G_GA0114241_11352 [Candidatus Kentron sp. MB]VFK35636.1 MAG: hypothetical protein BECKMB1821I_GA0114274_11343 [Candidatus Kentron sp. MB]VFK77476.1 MAG: hypothetical protein BECKMB1821H_GA0114242_11452 [Candidatus Kentron sp. MB]